MEERKKQPRENQSPIQCVKYQNYEIHSPRHGKFSERNSFSTKRNYNPKMVLQTAEQPPRDEAISIFLIRN